MGLKTTLVSILAVGLLASSAVGVAAQEEPAYPMRASTFKYDLGQAAERIEHTVTETDDGRSFRGSSRIDVPVEAGDARASGLFTWAQNEEAVGSVQAVSAVSRLVNDAGAWSGPWTGVLQLNKDRNQFRRQVAMGVLTGEGAYEGLTLFMTQTLDEQRGYIIPTDLLPPVPELPAEEPAE